MCSAWRLFPWQPHRRKHDETSWRRLRGKVKDRCLLLFKIEITESEWPWSGPARWSPPTRGVHRRSLDSMVGVLLEGEPSGLSKVLGALGLCRDLCSPPGGGVTITAGNWQPRSCIINYLLYTHTNTHAHMHAHTQAQNLHKLIGCKRLKSNRIFFRWKKKLSKFETSFQVKQP